MKKLMIVRLAITVTIFWSVVLCMSGLARAIPITAYGTPVDEIGSDVMVASCGSANVGTGCYDAASHTINFFIPINESYGGIYGVDTNPSGFKVGTNKDAASAPFSNPDILTMYVRYSPLAGLGSLSSAVLQFNFLDLDLSGGNDPTGFFESVQFFSGGGEELSSSISILPQNTSEYTVAGNDTSQTITFSDITPYITGDPFYAKLAFSSEMLQGGTWKNTVESMTTTLVTSVPEPSSFLLLAFGLATLACWRKLRHGF